ncbi:MAG TPA: hypothetical protein VFI70_00540 [Nitrososphaeraceae archaeon]|nr:hypothetical protein [Nitrososphaeraceae archaeon]
MITKKFVDLINSSKSYKGDLLAAKTVIIDEIALCPNKALARIRHSSKPTCAACEHSGNAFCKNHIQKFIIPTIANIVNNSYITNCLCMISANGRTPLCSSFH